MSNETTYRVYIIKCTTTGCAYFNFTSSKIPSFNPLRFLYNANKRDPTRYVKLAESIKTNGYNNHKSMFVGSFTKDNAQEKVYNMQKAFLDKNPDKSLNDNEPISSEKETCESCGQTYRKVFHDVHLEKYCKNRIFDDMIDFINA